MRNKKAIAKYTVIVWTWLIFTALILFFFLLFGISLRGCGDKTAVQEIKGDSTDELLAELTLLNYLRTPVEFDGTKMTMADLIYQYSSKEFKDKDLELKFKEITAGIFKNFESCYRKGGFGPYYLRTACILISDNPKSLVLGPYKASHDKQRFCTEKFSWAPESPFIHKTVQLPLQSSKPIYVHIYHSYYIPKEPAEMCERYLA